MKTCSSTRSPFRVQCKPVRATRGVRGRRLAALVVLPATLALALATGCSDDVVCSEDTTPYISARIEEMGATRAGSTYVEVYCSNDPLPGTLDVTVSERELPEATGTPDQMGLSTVLSETQIVWQPGTNCLLEVSTEYGIAAAQEHVPGPFEVAAPGTVTLGETLTLTWSDSEDAAYYLVEAELAGSGDTRDFDFAIEGTSALLDTALIDVPGVLNGRVWAVTGPFPQAGATGNVVGEGWGYFNIFYADDGSGFEVVIEEGRAPR